MEPQPSVRPSTTQHMGDLASIELLPPRQDQHLLIRLAQPAKRRSDQDCLATPDTHVDVIANGLALNPFGQLLKTLLTPVMVCQDLPSRAEQPQPSLIAAGNLIQSPPSRQERLAHYVTCIIDRVRASAYVAQDRPVARVVQLFETLTTSIHQHIPRRINDIDRHRHERLSQHLHLQHVRQRPSVSGRHPRTVHQANRLESVISKACCSARCLGTPSETAVLGPKDRKANVVMWSRSPLATGATAGSGNRPQSRLCAVGLATRTRAVTGRVRLDGDGGQRSYEVGPQRFTNDAGLVDTVAIGALFEKVRELVIESGVDGG